MLKYPFCLEAASGGEEVAETWFVRLPDDEDERDCCDALG